MSERRFKTALELAEESLRRHKPFAGDTKVTAESHPALFEAFETISHDGGFSAGHACYYVPAWSAPISLQEVEALLAKVSEDDKLDHLVLGEHSDIQAFVKANPEYAPVDALFHAFFEDFA